MEEQKDKKTVGNDKAQKKPSYEELNNYCVQLYNQNKQLAAQLQQMNAANLFKRLDYLFLVVQNKEAFKSEEGFWEDCVHEIREALTIAQEERKAGDAQEDKKETIGQ